MAHLNSCHIYTRALSEEGDARRRKGRSKSRRKLESEGRRSGEIEAERRMKANRGLTQSCLSAYIHARLVHTSLGSLEEPNQQQTSYFFVFVMFVA